MSWLVVLFALEFGAVTQNGWWLYEDDHAVIAPGPSYYTELDSELWAYDTLFVRSRLRTEIDFKRINSWSPYWVTYDLSLGVRFDLVEIGFRHLCTHPIQPYATVVGVRSPVLEGAFEEVYLRIGARR